MPKKKELSEEELENISGGSCDNGDGGGTLIGGGTSAGDTLCQSCNSSNVVITASAYAVTWYRCNDCGTEFRLEEDDRW